VGFSETAFVTPRAGRERLVRYFSPAAEVPFCGHATIATGVQLGDLHGDGTFLFTTPAGRVTVDVRTRDGRREASLTSVEPRHEPVPAELLTAVLGAIGWRHDDLDPSIPPARAYAGAWHLVLAASRADRLASLRYDFDHLRRIMLGAGLTTLQLVWRERPELFHARDPFPVGGVVEDPATGAAAAALGGYLRDAGLIDAPARVEIRQGDAMGRPSRLVVDIPASGGIVVTGNAVRLPDPADEASPAAPAAAASASGAIRMRSIAPAFLVSDVDATAAWYAEALGFATTGVFPSTPPAVWASIQRGGAEIMLQRLPGYRKNKLYDQREGGVWDAYVRTNGVHALYATVRDQPFVRMPLTRQPYGDWEFEVEDPNGYVVVFGGDETLDHPPPSE
jgi:PhzF family phenazine biosynthesis protein